MSSGPRNRTTRAERIGAWNAATEEGRRYRPRALQGEGVRYEWTRALQASDLSAMTRLVGITLVLNGDADGTKIFPGIRKVAEQAGLSERAVSTHIDRLVRRGLLSRKPRGGNTAGARGFEYLLLRPEVLNEIQHGAPVLKVVQHSVERGAVSVERDDSSVLNRVSPTSLLPVHIPASDARALDGAPPAKPATVPRSHLGKP